MKGYFITLEGIEGSGKSTQAKLLTSALQQEGLPALLTREPGGTPLGEKIAALLLDPKNAPMDPITELLLYAASRAAHVQKVIRPHLERGGVVVCDRFSDATRAYQGAGRGINHTLVEETIALATQGLTPHLTLLFDCSTELGLSRARARNRERGNEKGDRLEQEAKTFHENVRKGYREVAQNNVARFIIIDASKDVASVHEKVMTEVKKRIQKTYANVE